MKINFIFRHAGCLRIFDSTLRALSTAGHKVHLIYNLDGERVGHELTELLVRDHPDISWEFAPPPSSSEARTVMLFAAAIDWLRYRDPRYGNAARLSERADQRLRRAGPAFGWGLRNFARVAGWQRAISSLQKILLALPADATIAAFLRSRPADVTVISPLIDFGSEQVEYLRAAMRLGHPTALCVHSWDNLTNKGLTRISPDRVVVWNEAQAAEARDMHGIPAERIAVTGAQVYDQWFTFGHSSDRAAFLRAAGLDPEVPYVLFTGSSQFIGGDKEPALVADLMRACRASTDPAVRRLQFLVRPHPQNPQPWDDVADVPASLAVVPRGGALPVGGSERGQYFDSIFHAAAVVGVNTSAMIESSIIGRPVLTVGGDRFRDTQEGTLHFRHLTEGGHLLVANDPERFAAMVGDILSGRLDTSAATREFLRAFIRPRGLDQPSTPAIVDAILTTPRFDNDPVRTGSSRFARGMASVLAGAVGVGERALGGGGKEEETQERGKPAPALRSSAGEPPGARAETEGEAGSIGTAPPQRSDDRVPAN